MMPLNVSDQISGLSAQVAMFIKAGLCFKFIFLVALVMSPELYAQSRVAVEGDDIKRPASDAGNCRFQDKAGQKTHEAVPHILFTDILSGPRSGGEDDQGAYLSIYGFNFGPEEALGRDSRICINNIEVASYKYMGLAFSQFAYPNKNLQQIIVQIGRLDNSPTGIKLPLHIEVNGVVSPQKHYFTIQPGDIYYVDNVNGADSTGKKNDPSKPFRYVQTAGEIPGGVIAHVQPGDFIVMRGGKTWTDIGQGNRFLRFRYITGTSPTGKSGDGPITVMGYPGEDVLIQCQDDSRCGIHGVDGYAKKKYEIDADWITISNLRIRGGGPKVSGGPINLQHKSDNWRIVNNELFDWNANDRDNKIIDGKKYRDARAGGITGDGHNIKILGNYIHDIDGGTRNHGIYIDGGADNVEIAFNHLARLYGGNIIQTYDSVGLSGSDSNIKNINIHHNLMHDTTRYGINIAQGTRSAIISNNLIYNTAYSGLRFNTKSGHSIQSFHNTLYNVCTNPRNSDYAAINSDGAGRGIVIKNNIVRANRICPRYFFSQKRYGELILENNLYYGRVTNVPGRDKLGISENPLFINLKKYDFRLQKDSGAINSGVKTIKSIIYDFLMDLRDSNRDIGAFEYGATI